jgi:uncharacterized membrane protein YqaE (UPF0057 family)
MLYLLAIFLPPLAVLLCSKPVQAVLNLILCLTCVGAWVHAVLVVADHKANQRTNRLIRAMNRGRVCW